MTETNFQHKPMTNCNYMRFNEKSLVFFSNRIVVSDIPVDDCLSWNYTPRKGVVSFLSGRSLPRSDSMVAVFGGRLKGPSRVIYQTVFCCCVGSNA